MVAVRLVIANWFVSEMWTFVNDLEEIYVATYIGGVTVVLQHDKVRTVEPIDPSPSPKDGRE